MSIRNDRTEVFRTLYVCSEGISPLPTAVDAIVNFVKPEKQRALRRYLGMVNYHHHFIPHCAEKLTHLYSLLTEATKARIDFRLSLITNYIGQRMQT